MKFIKDLPYSIKLIGYTIKAYITEFGNYSLSQLKALRFLSYLCLIPFYICATESLAGYQSIIKVKVLYSITLIMGFICPTLLILDGIKIVRSKRGTSYLFKSSERTTYGAIGSSVSKTYTAHEDIGKNAIILGIFRIIIGFLPILLMFFVLFYSKNYFTLFILHWSTW